MWYSNEKKTSSYTCEIFKRAELPNMLQEC
jgi:hypothetical protein